MVSARGQLLPAQREPALQLHSCKLQVVSDINHTITENGESINNENSRCRHLLTTAHSFLASPLVCGPPRISTHLGHLEFMLTCTRGDAHRGHVSRLPSPLKVNNGGGCNKHSCITIRNTRFVRHKEPAQDKNNQHTHNKTYFRCHQADHRGGTNG